MIKKSRVFNMATTWKLKDVVELYLPDEERFCGGYIDEKYRNVRITVTAEIVHEPTGRSGE